MKKLITALSLIIILFVLNGCGGGKSQPADYGDKIMKQQIKEMNELASDIENDKADREDHLKKTLELGKRNDEALSDYEEKRLFTKYKVEIDKVNARIQSALLKQAAVRMRAKHDKHRRSRLEVNPNFP